MHIVIDKNTSGQRTDRYLRKYLPETSLGEIYKLIRRKDVRLNGERVRPETFLKEGDVLEIFLPAGKLRTGKAEGPVHHGELTVVYENAHTLVVFKPVGLKTIPDHPGELSLSGLVQTYLKALCTDMFRPSPVSRLDRNTAGLVLFAKDYEHLRHYNRLMRDGQLKKYYLALIFGTINQEGLHIVPMKKESATNTVSVDPRGYETRTILKTLCKTMDRSLLEIELLTGKSHQIRVLLAHLGNPIVGDPKYGHGGTHQRLLAYRLDFDGQRITYLDPDFGKEIEREFSHACKLHHSHPGKCLSV